MAENSPGRVLFIQPHNDDAAISLGGVLSKLVRAGWEIHYIYITDSRRGGDDPSVEKIIETRKAEAAKERELLSISSFTELGLPDQSLPSLSQSQRSAAITAIQQAILKCKPDLVFIPSKSDLHPDHTVAHDLALAALQDVFPAPLVAKYFVWLLPPFYPTPIDPAAQVVLVGIDQELETKVKLIRCHQSQLERRRYDQAIPHLNTYFAIMLKAEKKIGAKTAEIIGLYPIPENERFCSRLIKSLSPAIDITTVLHGKES